PPSRADARDPRDTPHTAPPRHVPPPAGGPAPGRHRVEAMTDQPRWLPLDGAANARDLGGLPTDGGGETAAHRLLRSDNLQGLTPGDVRFLVDDVGLRTVVDLRTD